jgi:hypothetical protein
VDYDSSRIIKDMSEENLKLLKQLINEVVKEMTLDEFSGAGAVAGFSLPLGMKPPKFKNKKRKKLKESKQEFTLQNYFRYTINEEDYREHECEYYYDGLDSLARAFASAEHPFGSNKSKGLSRVQKYLQGQLKYPHST